MKTLITLGCCFFSLLLQAQIVTVKKQYKVNSVNTERTFHPKFSKDGSQLLLTSSNFKGLDLMHLSTGKLTTLSTEQGAGYNAHFTAKDSKVVYVAAQFIQRRRHNVVKQYAIAPTQTQTVSAPLRAKEQVNQLISQQIDQPIIKLEDFKLVLYSQDKRTVLQPLKNQEKYLWPSLSPNGKRIVFTAVGKGTYICDLKGKVTASLGYLNAPVWYGNDAVVGMNDKDNGDHIISSTIDIVKADGSVRQVLTQSNIALYPAASAKAQKIAYTTDNGELFLLELTQP